MKNIKSSNGKLKITYKEIRLKSEERQIESEKIENDTPCKWKSKESWSSNTHIR